MTDGTTRKTTKELYTEQGRSQWQPTVASLYANAKLWGKRFSQVCGTVMNMIDALYEAVPQVRALIDAGRIRLQTFQHPRFKRHILKTIIGWGRLLYMPACTVFCEIHTALGTSLS